MGWGGIATSGWRGRSFSLGIADAVTVCARNAAGADAAATVIANAVDLPGHAAIIRAPADSIQAETDLGGRLVTRGVGTLHPLEVGRALDAGARVAGRLRAAGLIVAAVLHCQGQTRVCSGRQSGLGQQADGPPERDGGVEGGVDHGCHPGPVFG